MLQSEVSWPSSHFRNNHNTLELMDIIPHGKISLIKLESFWLERIPDWKLAFIEVQPRDRAASRPLGLEKQLSM